MKKLRRRQEWEAGREVRAERWREKRKEKQERRQAEVAESKANGQALQKKTPVKGYHIPMTIIIDCSFDDLMTDVEVTSLGQQISRGYSAVRNSKYRPLLMISGFSGQLRHRYEVVQRNQYKN
jgi:tRNA (guanine9-N1)-methyltransferase